MPRCAGVLQVRFCRTRRGRSYRRQRVSSGRLGAYTAEDIERARAIIEAVISGRVVELVSLRRSEVRVTLATGSQITETGYGTGLGWLPIPGWRKRAKPVSYEPYMDDEPTS